MGFRYVEEVFHDQVTTFQISFVGTLASSCLLSGGLYMTPIIERIGARLVMICGTVMAPLGLVLSSFSTSPWHVFVTQGVVFGVFAGWTFTVSVGLPAQWFSSQRRGLATGLSSAGAGIGGVFFGPVTHTLISHLGYRRSLLVLGAIGWVLLGTATALLRIPSLSSSSSSVTRQEVNHPVSFYILLVFSFLITFGYFFPFFSVPLYAGFLGMDDDQGATLISVMSAMNAVARIMMGWTADKIGGINTLFITTFCSGLFSSLIWQFSHTYGIYVVYCVCIGFSSGTFVSLLPIIVTDLVGTQALPKYLSLCYAMTMFGNLFGSPIANTLLEHYNWTVAIQYTGAVSILASLNLLVLRYIRYDGDDSIWRKV
ncbi:major facilitator superfamily domain-containing protein [Halteromyces radiatus]|uniref:major facilitator superfamily domain-containing protein n=1 Tax=Halteromyces radiatus TaxID=101107 RepID=UPI00221E4BA1|nr:major facilitator superfamily domain-containing protein [Halteromyces radiatus]KAI8096442.1 major facilitator superfamily domain-containing protein [Halteromyces radiatus]